MEVSSENSLASEEKEKVENTALHERDSNADQTTSAVGAKESHSVSVPDAATVPSCFNTKTSLSKEVLVDRIRGTIYGNCIGDAIGLLTEFMTKAEARHIYGNYFERSMTQKLVEKVTGLKLPNLEYSMKYRDFHRERFETGDWTDDSDQMILILQTLLENNGKMVPIGFAQKMKKWCRKGFSELGDCGGMGIGRTTNGVLHHPQFLVDPHEAAREIWESSGQVLAPNGGVMRTSVLGIHDFGNIEEVISNTKEACQVTHADPRCIASCIAVTTAIALMLQGKHINEAGDYDVEAVIKEAFKYASEAAPEEELKQYMYADSLADLKLDESGKIGYTYKCMGSGFWSLRQNDFRASLEAIAYEAGDADTNGAVAGALLGCKLGASALPPSWLNGLKHKVWLDEKISKFLTLLGLNEEKEAKETL